MTETDLIAKLLQSVDVEISIGSSDLNEITSSCLDYFSQSDLRHLKAQIVDFLASDPSDQTLARLWKQNSHSTAADNPKKIGLLLEMVLNRLAKRIN